MQGLMVGLMVGLGLGLKVRSAEKRNWEESALAGSNRVQPPYLLC